MAPRPDVSEERKAQIFQAALACFSRKGYHRTTMDDIVAESGLSKGALYWYFKSKKELFISLFEEVIGQLGQAWEAIAADAETSATDRLLASLALFRAGLKEMVPFFGVMMEAWAQTRYDEDVESLIGELYEPYLEIMSRIIEEGVASGEFRVASAQATALVIMTLFDGITLALGVGLWRHDWDEIIDAAEELVLRGLGAEGARGG
ncbi:MAG: TetR/AcrR family transcriptional regulator [Anaerolineae bacterium]|nr:MAG: TetR/AcrR family transcriptional regulator [Anaerolineae bacterium]